MRAVARPAGIAHLEDPAVLDRIAASTTFNGKSLLDGSFDEPSGRGLLEARALRMGDFSVQRVKLQGAAGLAASAPLDLTVEADGLALGAVTAGNWILSRALDTPALPAPPSPKAGLA